jgi:hypothetical protein
MITRSEIKKFKHFLKIIKLLLPAEVNTLYSPDAMQKRTCKRLYSLFLSKWAILASIAYFGRVLRFEILNYRFDFL